MIGDVTDILMDEEKPAPIIIALVDGYDGNQKPVIGTFDIGNNLDLGLDFVKVDNVWQMVVGKKQDYEQPTQQKYFFYIIIDGKSSIVQIRINNIFDNSPVMTSMSSSDPCIIPVSF